MTKLDFKAHETLEGSSDDTGKVIPFVKNWKFLSSKEGDEIFGLGDLPEKFDRIREEGENWITFWRVVEVQELQDPSNYHWVAKVRRGSHANRKALSRLKMDE